MHAGAALGLLELGLGRPDEAVRALEPVGELALARGIEEPNFAAWQADLVEAYIRSGRLADADRELGVLERRARATGGRWAAAAALRCRGLLARADRVDAIFGKALELHGRQPLVIERARTELCWAQCLRRDGRPAEAREPLRRALAVFQRTGAQPWAAMAQAELQAGGERQGRAAAAAELKLTAQELQVARVVATGATNAEAAAQLFISAKTVEKHLTSAYRKLGVRSRTELARRFAIPEPERQIATG
jgi:DNA-binding CsgD family transcriptional regulator